MKRLLILSFIILLNIPAHSQSSIVKDFRPACDSLRTLIPEKTTVKGGLRIKNILKRDGQLDFYFDESLGDFPFRRGDAEWFRNTLRSLFPEKYRSYSIGGIYTKNVDIKTLEVASLSFKFPQL